MQGSRELTRSATAYLACLTFAMSFLVTTATGGAGTTALFRATIVAVATYWLGRLLVGPLITQLLAAMARDSASRQRSAPAEDAE